MREVGRKRDRRKHTWVATTLVVGVPLLERLVNILLPVADGPARVDASGQGVSLLDDLDGPGFDHGEADGSAGDGAGGEENEGHQLFIDGGDCQMCMGTILVFEEGHVPL